jgi:hypothetical protein
VSNDSRTYLRYLAIGAGIGAAIGAAALVLIAGADSPALAWVGAVGYTAIAGLTVAGLLSFDAGRKP